MPRPHWVQDRLKTVISQQEHYTLGGGIMELRGVESHRSPSADTRLCPCVLICMRYVCICLCVSICVSVWYVLYLCVCVFGGVCETILFASRDFYFETRIENCIQRSKSRHSDIGWKVCNTPGDGSLAVLFPARRERSGHMPRRLSKSILVF